MIKYNLSIQQQLPWAWGLHWPTSAIFAVAWATGLRDGDFLGLLAADLDFQ
jgi:hypothetical protein